MDTDSVKETSRVLPGSFLFLVAFFLPLAVFFSDQDTDQKRKYTYQYIYHHYVLRAVYLQPREPAGSDRLFLFTLLYMILPEMKYKNKNLPVFPKIFLYLLFHTLIIIKIQA